MNRSNILLFQFSVTSFMDVDHGYFNQPHFCIGALTAFRSAPPRTIAFWELISFK
jgi:hypothetical protein